MLSMHEYQKVVAKSKQIGLANLHIQLMKKLYSGTITEHEHSELLVVEELKKGRRLKEARKLENIKSRNYKFKK